MSIDRQKVIDAAQKFAAKNQFDKALAEYQRVLREDPTDVRVLLKVGDLQVRMNLKTAAVETYGKVAQSYDQQGFFLKGVAVYKQILQIDPARLDLYTRLCELYLKLGLTSDALQNLEVLAQRHARSGDDAALVDVYRRMISVDPAAVVPRIRLAELLSRVGNADEAATEFEAACGLLERSGRLDEWSKVGERLFFHRQNDVRLAQRLAAYYLERDDARRALPKLQIAYKANPKDVQTLEQLGAAFRGLGQIQKTLSVLKEVARIHGEAGRARERNDVYQRVLELAPTDADAREALRVGAGGRSRRTSAPPPSMKPKADSVPPVVRTVPPEDVLEVDAELVGDDGDAVFELKPTVPPGSESRIPPAAEVISDGRRQRAATPSVGPTTVSVSRPFAAQGAPAGGSSPPVDRGPAAEALRLVNEAEIFLKYGLRSKVADHLGRASRLDPVSAELHVRVRDLYAAMNDPAGVLNECLQLATILQEADPAAALDSLHRALEIDPSNAIARQLVAMFGGEELSAPHIEESHEAPAEPIDTELYASSEHFREELPDNLALYGDEHGAHDDDPAIPYGTPEEAPPRREIEDGLDEAEFFVTQGLYDDARDVLLQLLEVYPNHPLVIDRWTEIEQIVQAQENPGSEGADAVPLADEIGAVEDPLWADVAPDGSTDMQPVFEAGTSEAMSLEDCDTHYDLGIAYKEMGLLDDAIAEFRVATGSPARRCIGELMLGICHIEKGDPNAAIEHFREGLRAPQRTEHEELGLYFEIGNAYELLGDIGEALYYFQRVEKHDPTFRNVQVRVLSIQQHGASAPTRASTSMAPGAEEVDAAFDDLIKV